MGSGASVGSVVTHSRTRVRLQLLIEECAWGLVAGLVVFSLLLLFGAQVVKWYWPVLALVVVAGVSVWRAWGRIPGEYETAQRLDQAIDSKDLLSTAWHLQRKGADSQFAKTVERQAEEAAAVVQPEIAFPWRAPLAWKPLAFCLAGVMILFGVRYVHLQTMDLRAPLAEVWFDTLTGLPEPKKELARRSGGKGGELPDFEGLSVGDKALSDELARELQQQALMAEGAMSAPGQKGMSPSSTGDPMSSGDPTKQGNRTDMPGEQGSDSESTPEGKNRDTAARGKEQNGLLDKMRDAMSNLMEKFNANSNPQQSPQGQQGAEQAQSETKGQKQQNQSGRSKAETQAEELAQGMEASDSAGENSKSSQSEQSARDKNPQERSGAGRSDGSKDLELAEHAEAMGKITELLGKRARSLQGDITVEVKDSRNQTVRTPYSDRKVTHSDAGGEVSRDEVPLHLQPYVRRYYEQVRRQPDAGTAQK
jgi:hypothetical protein